MKAVFRFSIVAVVAAAALATPAAGSAAPASTRFAIVGYEYAFTSTRGTFAGVGTGNGGDRAAWNTSVVHDPLGSSPTYVNGGSFEMTSAGPTGVDFVIGTFAYHGGTITTIDPGAGCTNQRFRVTGTLKDVTTTTTSGGSGSFAVILTHYRRSLFGHCLIYAARVAGRVTFRY